MNKPADKAYTVDVRAVNPHTQKQEIMMVSSHICTEAGKYFLELVMKLSMISKSIHKNKFPAWVAAGDKGGHTEYGSNAEYSLLNPEDVISRAQALTKEAFKTLEAEGWMITMPTIDDILKADQPQPAGFHQSFQPNITLTPKMMDTKEGTDQ